MDKIRVFLGTAYMMAMGVCGVVLTAIGSTLDQIAIDCNTTSTAIGTVFLARGAGAILGAVMSAKFYAPPTKGNNIMMVRGGRGGGGGGEQRSRASENGMRGGLKQPTRRAIVPGRGRDGQCALGVVSHRRL